jgi:hypothetical protein
MAKKFTGKIALGLDAKGSKVATHGWTQDSSQTVLEFATEAAKLPLAAIIYTDIAKDGMMSGPNFERTRAIAEAVDVPVVASGGSSLRRRQHDRGHQEVSQVQPRRSNNRPKPLRRHPETRRCDKSSKDIRDALPIHP